MEKTEINRVWLFMSVELRAAIVKMVGRVKAKNLKLKAQSHSVKLKSKKAKDEEKE